MTTLPMIKFPLAELTPLHPEQTPNAFEIRNLKKEIMGNARSISTALGGGNHGHLGLILPQAEYAAIAPGNPFIIPAHPQMPVLAGGAGAAAAVNAQAAYTRELNEYLMCTAVENNLKKMLLQAVPHIFVKAVEDHDYGFGNVTTETLLTHLVTTYGTISQTELEKNLQNLETPFDPENTIEKFFSMANK